MTYEEINREKSALLLDKIHEEMESVRFTGRMEFHNGKWGGIYGNADTGFKRRVDGKFELIGDAA